MRNKESNRIQQILLIKYLKITQINYYSEALRAREITVLVKSN